jgi:hypothetical protein
MKPARAFAFAIAFLFLASTLTYGQSGTAGQSSQPGTSTTKTKAKNPPSDPSKIPQAPGGGDGKVWVNTETKVYHIEGDEWYGKTKHGKYMTEAEAIKAGYHKAKAPEEKPKSTAPKQ